MDHCTESDEHMGLVPSSGSNNANLSNESIRDSDDVPLVAFDLRLAPETQETQETQETTESSASVAGGRGAAVGKHASLAVHNSTNPITAASERDPESIEVGECEQAATLYPRERHYSTLDAMQRLTKLFGYAAISIMFPYLTFRFVRILWTCETGLLQELGTFSEFAVPALFGTVGLVGLLFTLSEGLRLAMDIQDNTLRIANRSGRRKR